MSEVWFDFNHATLLARLQEPDQRKIVKQCVARIFRKVATKPDGRPTYWAIRLTELEPRAMQIRGLCNGRPVTTSNIRLHPVAPLSLSSPLSPEWARFGSMSLREGNRTDAQGERAMEMHCSPKERRRRDYQFRLGIAAQPR